jgi:hypothetical protein
VLNSFYLVQSPDIRGDCCRNATELRQHCLLILGRENFLNTHLVNEVIAFQIGQMRSLFIVCQMRADSLCHHQNHRPIIHVQPVAATNKLIVAIARERTVGLTAKVGLIKSGHERQLHKQRTNQASF